jgi:hypothetical protein
MTKLFTSKEEVPLASARALREEAVAEEEVRAAGHNTSVISFNRSLMGRAAGSAREF